MILILFALLLDAGGGEVAMPPNSSQQPVCILPTGLLNTDLQRLLGEGGKDLFALPTP